MPNCPNCGFKGWLKTGKRDTETGLRLYSCGRCGEDHPEDKPFERKSPKVLYLDIETSLTQLHGNFGLRVPSKYISPKMVKRPSYIICWAAQWVDEIEENKETVYGACVTPKEAIVGTDKNILAPLWDLIDRADILAGHNIDQFDIPIITSRYMVNGFDKPDIFKTYDTKKMAKKHRYESNTLDYLCWLYGFPMKQDMQIEDWIAIQEGSKPALNKMFTYCKDDVKERGVPVLRMMLESVTLPRGYGLRKFPSEPKDSRNESRVDFDDLIDSVNDLRDAL